MRRGSLPRTDSGAVTLAIWLSRFFLAQWGGNMVQCSRCPRPERVFGRNRKWTMRESAGWFQTPTVCKDGSATAAPQPCARQPPVMTSGLFCLRLCRSVAHAEDGGGGKPFKVEGVILDFGSAEVYEQGVGNARCAQIVYDLRPLDLCYGLDGQKCIHFDLPNFVPALC